MANNIRSSGKKNKQVKTSIVVKSIFGIVMLLIVFSVIVSIMGFHSFTDALLEEYADGAFHTAATAAMVLDTDRMEAYAQSGGTTDEYKKILATLQNLCRSSDSTFIYVIRPDLADYKHITFLFSTINPNSGYDRYAFGHVRETTNEEYMEKYRHLYEGTSEQELVIRDQGYIETDPHITAMVSLKDSDGKTTAILCVQRQMENLVDVRNAYIGKVLIVMIVLTILVIIGQLFYLHRVFIRPITRITHETSRFAQENKTAEKKLTETVKNNDELGVLAVSIDQMEERILQYMNDLTKATAEKEHINTELALAARIQADMLPSTFPAFPGYAQIDIFASMDPAKNIGGDFYDFFLVDKDHLCLVMADVSGKGIPAALFMMAAKIILANDAKMGGTPSEILTAANTAICANNRENMFVTVWLGILEISTGKLTAANAGHEYPVLRQPDGSFALFKDKHGFVVGCIEGMRYEEYTIELKPGAKLFLYTDGVPEATNSEKQLFGTERMVAALNEKPDSSPQEILKTVRRSVDDFVKEAEQFDDLTMLCIEYRGTTE